MYSVMFMGCVFIIWYTNTQTTCIHITLWAFVFCSMGTYMIALLILFSKRVLNSCVTISELVLIRPGSHSPCWDDGYTSRAAVWHRPVAMRLWPSWIFCSYTVMPSSTVEQSEQHLEVSSAFPIQRNPYYYPVHWLPALASIWTTIFIKQPMQRSLQILSLSTCKASPCTASCNHRQGLKNRLKISRYELGFPVSKIGWHEYTHLSLLLRPPPKKKSAVRAFHTSQKVILPLKMS